MNTIKLEPVDPYLFDAIATGPPKLEISVDGETGRPQLSPDPVVPRSSCPQIQLSPDPVVPRSSCPQIRDKQHKRLAALQLNLIASE